MKKYTIDVTQADIDAADGWMRDGREALGYYSQNCPVARAARRVLGLKKKRVAVDQCVLSVDDHDFTLPVAARKFILSWDNEKEVKPFTFEVSS